MGRGLKPLTLIKKVRGWGNKKINGGYKLKLTNLHKKPKGGLKVTLNGY